MDRSKEGYAIAPSPQPPNELLLCHLGTRTASCLLQPRAYCQSPEPWLLWVYPYSKPQLHGSSTLMHLRHWGHGRCGLASAQIWSHQSVNTASRPLLYISASWVSAHQTPVLPLLWEYPQLSLVPRGIPLTTTPAWEKKIRKYAAAFTTEDPNSPHSCCSYLQLRTPTIFANANPSCWNYIEMILLGLPHSWNHHIPPGRCPWTQSQVKVFPQQNQSNIWKGWPFHVCTNFN